MSSPQPLSRQTAFSKDIKVSVCCVTFNQVDYIRQALDGFLQQTTDFCVEILVHDDASTDGTAEIVAEYAQRYPGLIKAILQTDNQYSRGVNVMGLLRQAALGEYLAYCEGDDFWQDPNKLYAQAHYLDEHPQTVMVGQATQRIGPTGELLPEPPPSRFRSAFNLNADMSAFQLKTLHSMVPTCCKMFRKITLPVLPDAHKTPYGDAIKQSLLGQYGSYHFIEGLAPAVYRVHGQGLWSKDSALVQQQKMLQLYGILWRYYLEQKDHKVCVGFAQKIGICVLKYAVKYVMRLCARDKPTSEDARG